MNPIYNCSTRWLVSNGLCGVDGDRAATVLAVSAGVGVVIDSSCRIDSGLVCGVESAVRQDFPVMLVRSATLRRPVVVRVRRAGPG